MTASRQGEPFTEGKNYWPSKKSSRAYIVLSKVYARLRRLL